MVRIDDGQGSLIPQRLGTLDPSRPKGSTVVAVVLVPLSKECGHGDFIWESDHLREMGGCIVVAQDERINSGCSKQTCWASGSHIMKENTQWRHRILVSGLGFGAGCRDSGRRVPTTEASTET